MAIEFGIPQKIRGKNTALSADEIAALRIGYVPSTQKDFRLGEIDPPQSIVIDGRKFQRVQMHPRNRRNRPTNGRWHPEGKKNQVLAYSEGEKSAFSSENTDSARFRARFLSLEE